MTAKEIIEVILRTATLITIFVILLGTIGFLYDWVGVEVTLGTEIFWFFACFLTALKITFIKEDF